MLVSKQIPDNRKDPIYKYSHKDFSGVSFMLHPDVLLYHSHKYTYREIAQYISLCSFRSAVDFLSTQDTTLDLILVPGLEPETIINNNRLLMIDDDRVCFLYEEVPATGDTLMAISFNQQKGSAQKSSISSFQYKDGDNKFRLVGDILARYVYWIKGENDKNIPFECLVF